MKEILKFCTTMVYTLLHHLAWHHLMSPLEAQYAKVLCPCIPLAYLCNAVVQFTLVCTKICKK